MILSAGTYFLIQNRMYFNFSNIRFSLFKKQLPLALKIGATDLSRKIIVLVGLMTFRILIVKKLGMAENGYFQSIWSISLYMDILWTAFVSFFFPQISHAREYESVKQTLSESFEIILFVTFPLAAVVMMIPEWSLYILYDKSFVMLAGYLSILILFKFIELYYRTYLITFLAHTKLSLFLFIEFIRYSILLIVTYLLIGSYGLEGVIYGIVIMQVISFTMVLITVILLKEYMLRSETVMVFLKFILLLLILLIPDHSEPLWRIIKIFLFLVLTYKIVAIQKYVVVIKKLAKKS